MTGNLPRALPWEAKGGSQNAQTPHCAPNSPVSGSLAAQLPVAVESVDAHHRNHQDNQP
jgi:hypothetical protein